MKNEIILLPVQWWPVFGWKHFMNREVIDKDLEITDNVLYFPFSFLSHRPIQEPVSHGLRGAHGTRSSLRQHNEKSILSTEKCHWCEARKSWADKRPNVSCCMCSDWHNIKNWELNLSVYVEDFRGFSRIIIWSGRCLHWHSYCPEQPSYWIILKSLDKWHHWWVSLSDKCVYFTDIFWSNPFADLYSSGHHTSVSCQSLD